MKQMFIVSVIKNNTIQELQYAVTDPFLAPVSYPHHFFHIGEKEVCSAELIKRIMGDVDAACRTNFKLQKEFYSVIGGFVTHDDGTVSTKDKESDKDSKKSKKKHSSILNNRTSKGASFAAFILDKYNSYDEQDEQDEQDELLTEKKTDSRTKKNFFSVGRNVYIKKSPKIIKNVKDLLGINVPDYANPEFQCNELDKFAVFTRAFTLCSLSASSHKRISDREICQNSNSSIYAKPTTHDPDFFTESKDYANIRKGVRDAGLNVHVVTARETPSEASYRNEEFWIDGIDRSRERDLNIEMTIFDLLDHVTEYLYPEQERPKVNHVVQSDYTSNSEEAKNHAVLSLSGTLNVGNEEAIEHNEKELQRRSKLLEDIKCCVYKQSEFERVVWLPAIQNNPNFSAKLTRKYCPYYQLLINDPEGWSYLADFFRHFFIFLTEKQLDPSITQCIYLHLWQFYKLQLETTNTWKPLFDNEPADQDGLQEFLKKKANSMQHRNRKKSENSLSDEHDAGQSLYLQVISALFTQLCTLA